MHLKHYSLNSQTKIETLKQTLKFFSQKVNVLLASIPLLLPITWLLLATNPSKTRTPNHIENLPNQGNNIPYNSTLQSFYTWISTPHLTHLFIWTQHHMYAIRKPSSPHALLFSLSILDRLDLNFS